MRSVIHRLNQRYHAEWQRAELLRQQLEGRSWLGRLRRFFARSTPMNAQEIEPRPPAPGRVSVILPFRDQGSLLRACLRSLRGSTRPFQTVLVDNGSTEPKLLRFLEMTRRTVIRRDEAFNFSRLCNAGARAATGDWLLFLNNDTEALAPDWIDHLLSLVRPDVGIVGATLVYPDGGIQHAGLYPDAEGRWIHAHRHQPASLSQLSRPRLVPAVSAACLLIGRDTFDALGGFDESLPVTYNDVDLCIRAGHKGWKTALSPHARLIHYEGLTRGFSDDAPGNEHLAGRSGFPTGAGAWPGLNSTASDSPSGSARSRGG
jgi:O-antigen biosynthesis protein